MPLITDPDLLADSAADDGSEEVYINTSTKKIKLVKVGNLSDDGVTLKCLYSFLKEEWRNDPNTKNLAAFPFPMTPITDESFEFADGWDLFNDTARYLIRTAGWTVRNAGGLVTQRWAGIIGLGTIEANDQLYYFQTSPSGAVNIQLTGQVNQAVQILRDDDGDGDYSEGSDFDARTVFKLFCREYAQIYGKSSLTDIGVTSMDSIAYRFPISTAGDLKVQAADAVVAKSVAITSATWLAGVATINCGTVHGLLDGDFVRITGASPAGWNVRGTITYVDTDTFTIAIVGDPTAWSSGGTVRSIYNEIAVRYFDQAFTRDVDSATDRNYGIVIDVGTHSGVDGSTAGAGNTLTTAEGGIDTENNLYAGGTLVIHEGVDAGTYTISGNPTATSVAITTTFPTGASNQSFTIYPASGKAVPANAEKIYTKVQYLLRQNSDIDATDQSVIGKVNDELLIFVGDTLVCGSKAPANPNGGGSGVIIEGFLSSDTNRLEFYDNTVTKRTFPYVAVLQINFGDNLKNDGSAKYWVYFTTLPGVGDDYGEAGALLVDDNAGADMAGDISGVSSVQKSFNYDGNVQGGRSAGTDAGITVVGIGLVTGQYVKATGTIARSTANSVSLVAALERNYQNV